MGWTAFQLIGHRTYPSNAVSCSSKIRTGPIDIDDGFARADPHDGKTDIFLAIQNLGAMNDAAPEESEFSRTDNERLLSLFPPVNADLASDHIHYAVVIGMMVPLAGNITRRHPCNSNPETVGFIRCLARLAGRMRPFGEVVFADIDDIVRKDALTLFRLPLMDPI